MIVAVYEQCWDRKYSQTFYVDTDKIGASDPVGEEVRLLMDEDDEGGEYGYFICNNDDFGSQSTEDITIDLPVNVEAKITINYQ